MTAFSNLFAQNVLVTDDSNYVAKSSAMLDIKSSNKGLLIPRVALTSTSSALPITSPDSSLMVYNKATAGNVTPGYYFWDGAKWVRMANGQGGLNNVTKTASTILLPTETMVLASNNITLTLPAITSTDDGLAISIKNNGTYTDLITILPNGAATIDNQSNSTLTRWKGRTYVAAGGNWIVQEKETRTDNIYEISSTGSWTTIAEMIAFLNMHMTAPTVARLNGGTYPISATQVINLPYPLVIEGLSAGTSTIIASAGLTGKPMFRCLSTCYFKWITFDATTLAAYGNNSGEDAIRLLGSGIYYEIKECKYYHFYNTIMDSTNTDLLVMDCDVYNAQKNGILIQGNVPGAKAGILTVQFVNCPRGINLNKGSNALIDISMGVFINYNATDSAIIYNPSSFLTSADMVITGNSWDGVGIYITGFDFTRPDGRDASAYIEGNIGTGDNTPRCKINVRDNASVTTMTTANTYYKAVWTNTSSIPCKFTVANNKITYQSGNGRNAFITITGDISDNWYNTILTVAVIKNGVTATPYGETNISITSGTQPFQFATVIEIDNVAKNDYFEVYCYSNHSSDQVTFQDVQWLTECR
jgi:hypothetical protein